MRKTLPEIHECYDVIPKLSNQVMTWEILKTALELGIFDELKAPVLAEDVAARLSIHPQNTEHFLKSLVALGWATYEDSHFCATGFGKQCLMKGEDTYVGDFFAFMEKWQQSMRDGGILNLVRHGPKPTKNLGNADLWEYGARASLNYSRCGRAQLIAEHVAALPEFPKFSKILDLGGGNGVIGLAVAQKHPSLQCVVFEQGAVCKVIHEVITEYGAEDRVSAMAGNYMEDPIGDGYDFIMANFTLNFYRDNMDAVMEKICKALNPGGLFFVLSDGMNKDKTAPASSVLSWLSTSLMQQDMVFEHDEIEHRMLKAGFATTQCRLEDCNALSGGHGPVKITVGRKACA